MDLEAFLARCRSSWPEWGTRAIASSRSPSDRYLTDIADSLEGMTSENKLTLLNHAVACLEKDEAYVEIGCWKGKSLVGALRGNESKPAFACDNFSEFGGPRDEFERNIATHLRDPNLKFYDQDFESFLAAAPWVPSKVGVYFYDGGHSFDNQYVALERMLAHLSRRSLVIVDDTNLFPVRRANHLFARRVPGFRLIADIRTTYNGEPTWWNGVQLFYYEGRPAEVPLRPRAYEFEKWAWTTLAPPAARARDKVARLVRGVALRP